MGKVRNIVLAVTGSISLLFVSCLTWGFFHAEITCPWDKYIDTRFFGNFNKNNVEELLARIKPGMTKYEVIAVLGAPHDAYDEDTWDYSCDGAAPLDWDFSWFLIRIVFEDGKVVRTVFEEYGD